MHPAMLALMIPIAIIMIPIVAILCEHQRKMAKIIHGGANQDEVRALRNEVAELRSLVHRQLLANNPSPQNNPNQGREPNDCEWAARREIDQYSGRSTTIGY